MPAPVTAYGWSLAGRPGEARRGFWLSDEDIDLEQGYISVLYRRLDQLRERTSGRLAGVLRQTGGTHQARTEREIPIVVLARR